MDNTIALAQKDKGMFSLDEFKSQVLEDYRIAFLSRQVSLLGRREVLTGKAKFGIFGDGKELAQIAMAKFFHRGDFRCGYYRDQTFMFATGIVTIEGFFSQLFADTDIANEPSSGGRQMVGHFATPMVDENGKWLDLVNRMNIPADMSPTASQMPRSVGLAFASRCFREIPGLQSFTDLSRNGNEVCFCTIGDASTSEGHFWESINAAGVLQIPLAVFVYDDGYGISVPKSYQTTKSSISKALAGFQKEPDSNGIDIYHINGWDYDGMCSVFESGIQKVREMHVPAVFHIDQMTQPQGHSTSGSQERYKTAERLAWEKEWDCLSKFREWILSKGIASEEDLSRIETVAKSYARRAKDEAWQKYMVPIVEQVGKATRLLRSPALSDYQSVLEPIAFALEHLEEPLKRDVLHALSQAIYLLPAERQAPLKEYYNELKIIHGQSYSSKIYNEGEKSALAVKGVNPIFSESSETLNGYEILNKYFDGLLSRDPRVMAFGEDVGKLGDVNQGFAGLQEKYGEARVFDTGIRELTIVGQAIGLALRGLRPIAEIQYLDYLYYGLEPMIDDIASLHFRTNGSQSCPAIIRTRGHRLEGMWHSGSYLGSILNAIRGMFVCVPRNMVQAAGFYNTLMAGNDPALVIECLNGYRLKEKMPDNLQDFCVPLGVPEILREGSDITIVSYGSVLRIIESAIERLSPMGISCELIDVQTLLPFDKPGIIAKSIEKTNRVLFVDEDVPGGATAFMFNRVIERDGAYRFLDAQPRTLTSGNHKPCYGSDGDYFSKPNEEDVIDMVLSIMSE